MGVAAGRGVAVRGGGAVGTGMTVPRTYPMRSLIIQTPEMQKQINFFFKKMRQEMATHCSAEHLA